MKLPPLYCSKLSGTHTGRPSRWPTSRAMDSLVCALCFIALSTLKGEPVGIAGGEVGSEGCPGSCSVSGAELGLALKSLGALACHEPQRKDVGRGVDGTLTSDLVPFPRAQGRAPKDQGKQRLPRRAWSRWRRTPSTPPGRKVSRGGTGAASALAQTGLGSFRDARGLCLWPSRCRACSGRVSSGGTEDGGSRPLPAEGALPPAAGPGLHPAERAR